MNRLLITFGGCKVQGSVAVGVLHITVAGGGSYQGLNSLGMPIGSSIVQCCGPILSLRGTSTGLQMCSCNRDKSPHAISLSGVQP